MPNAMKAVTVSKQCHHRLNKYISVMIALIGSILLLISCLNISNGFADWMTNNFCDRKLEEGNIIMNNKVVTSDERSVKVYRGETQLVNGSLYTPGEELIVRINDVRPQYLYEVNLGKFQNGGCQGKRIANKKEVKLELPPVGSSNVTIVAAWAKGHGQVSISSAFLLVSPYTTDSQATLEDSKPRQLATPPADPRQANLVADRAKKLSDLFKHKATTLQTAAGNDTTATADTAAATVATVANTAGHRQPPSPDHHDSSQQMKKKPNLRSHHRDRRHHKGGEGLVEEGGGDKQDLIVKEDLGAGHVKDHLEDVKERYRQQTGREPPETIFEHLATLEDLEGGLRDPITHQIPRFKGKTLYYIRWVSRVLIGLGLIFVVMIICAGILFFWHGRFAFWRSVKKTAGMNVNEE